ncbi:alpha-glucosidase [Niveispirillum lacus]|uniref:Alpha-glucosidase n=2 Tax=Niveispirillum lacus TaxID=1981099 RepID=A0A255YRF5_9PROT|nr:alpha-glucosidase [Niveispirillum lacus]
MSVSANAVRAEGTAGPDQGVVRPWWQGAVIYQVYPRSFADSNGDGIGDLKGLLAHLDHVADLGADAIWISPFFKSPMDDFGYDISDHCDIDPIFGTMADCDAVIARAHDLGLKIIIDQVYSHTSIQHRWFQESRQNRTNAKADWYVWHDARPDGTPPNNWQSVFGGPAWTWDARRRQYYMHNFLSSQPDLNLHNPDVQEAIKGVARFWMDRGVDGLRVDAANFFMHDRLLRDNPVNKEATAPKRPYEFQQQIHNISQPENLEFIEDLRAVLDSYPDRFMVAEMGEAPFDMVADYTLPGKRCHSAYNFSFLYHKQLDAGVPRRIIGGWNQASGGAWPSWTFSNHDAPRAVTRWGGDMPPPELARCLNTLLVSLPGSVFLYYGEELGLPQARVAFEDLVDPEAIANWPHTLGRDGARTPMPWVKDAPHAGFSTGRPWLPVDPRHLPLAVDVQAQDPASTLSVTRRLLARRRSEPALRWGEIRFRPPADPVLAFERIHDAGDLLVVVNLAGTSAPHGLIDAANWIMVESVNGATLSAPDLPAYGALIARRG